MSYKQYDGIDLREIKCCDNSEDTIEAGISFDSDNENDILRFHFLEYLKLKNGERLLQVTEKHMYLNKENTMQLIERLKSFL